MSDDDYTELQRLTTESAPTIMGMSHQLSGEFTSSEAFLDARDHGGFYLYPWQEGPPEHDLTYDYYSASIRADDVAGEESCIQDRGA